MTTSIHDNIATLRKANTATRARSSACALSYTGPQARDVSLEHSQAGSRGRECCASSFTRSSRCAQRTRGDEAELQPEQAEQCSCVVFSLREAFELLSRLQQLM
eukprot:scaffold1465_cov383-Prasinococcus_capsulatus_cf.AAC.17